MADVSPTVLTSHSPRNYSEVNKQIMTQVWRACLTPVQSFEYLQEIFTEVSKAPKIEFGTALICCNRWHTVCSEPGDHTAVNYSHV